MGTNRKRRTLKEVLKEPPVDSKAKKPVKRDWQHHARNTHKNVRS